LELNGSSKNAIFEDSLVLQQFLAIAQDRIEVSTPKGIHTASEQDGYVGSAEDCRRIRLMLPNHIQ
jgi:hypothetical protein